MKILKKYRKTARIGILFSILLYAMIMSLQLTNTYDGLWNMNYHQSGAGVLSSGRWLLYYIDRLTLGIHADPINSLMVLSLYVSGFLYLLDLFRCKCNWTGTLALLLFISSTAVSNTLSYRMTSFAYGLAFLFAILSAYYTFKINRWSASWISGILLGMSAGIYQAYLSVFALVCVFFLIHTCSNSTEEEPLESVTRLIIKVVTTTLIGGAVYIGSLKFFLHLNNVTLSNYNDIGNITLSGLFFSLPKKIWKTLHVFKMYFLSNNHKLNTLQSAGIYYLLLILLFVLLIYLLSKSWKKNKLHAPGCDSIRNFHSDYE